MFNNKSFKNYEISVPVVTFVPRLGAGGSMRVKRATVYALYRNFLYRNFFNHLPNDDQFRPNRGIKYILETSVFFLCAIGINIVKYVTVRNTDNFKFTKCLLLPACVI